jgi:uncharacterized membrane protein YccC
MLLFGKAIHDHLFVWAAIGAFWTCLVDAAGTTARRLNSMAGFALLSTLVGAATAFTSRYGLLPACATVLVVGFCAGFASVLPSVAYQVAVVAATTCVVVADAGPQSLSDSLPFLGTYFAGCVFATILSLAVWRVHPFEPSRRAVRLVYVRLADSMRDIARLSHDGSKDADEWSGHAAAFRPLIRQSIEAAHACLLTIPQPRLTERPLLEALMAALDDADRLLGLEIAVSAALAESRRGPRRRVERCLHALAEVLGRIGDAIGDVAGTYPPRLRARIPREAGRLCEALGIGVTMSFPGGVPAAKRDERSRTPWMRAMVDDIGDAVSVIRANFRFSSNGFRHAVRMSFAVTAAFVIEKALRLPFGYWATISVLFVLQPTTGSTHARGVERAVGTAAGAALATAIGAFVHTSVGLSLAVFPLICLTMALRRVSYSLYVAFLTPSFVLVADFAAPSNELLHAAIRLENNLLGCAIAVVATVLFWPSRRIALLAPAIIDAVEANALYLQGALRSFRGGEPDAELDELRRAAGIATADAEAAYHHDWPDRTGDDRRARRLFVMLRTLSGAAAVLQYSRHAPAGTIELLEAIDRDVGDTAAAMRRWRAFGQADFSSPLLVSLERDTEGRLERLCALLSAWWRSLSVFPPVDIHAYPTTADEKS